MAACSGQRKSKGVRVSVWECCDLACTVTVDNVLTRVSGSRGDSVDERRGEISIGWSNG